VDAFLQKTLDHVGDVVESVLAKVLEEHIHRRPVASIGL
jgi:hypothetical protein